MCANHRNDPVWVFGFYILAFALIFGASCGYKACTAEWKCQNLNAENVAWFPDCVCERDGERFQCDRADQD